MHGKMDRKAQSVVEEKVPVNGALGRGFGCAAEHALERLLLGVLGRAGADVPHAERDGAGRGYDHLVFGEPRVVGVLEPHIGCDAVQEAG